MKLSSLEDYQKSEEEEAKKIFRSMLKRTGEFSQLDFFPQIKKQVSGRLYTNVITWANRPTNPLLQLPFYEKILLPIPSYRTHSIFKQCYGLSVGEMLHLIDEGKIVPFLSHPPTDYADVENQYLDPLLERRIPCVRRCAEYWELLMRKQGIRSPDKKWRALLREADKSLRGTKPSKQLARFWKATLDDTAGKRIRIKTWVKGMYAVATVFEYGKIAHTFLNSGDFDQVFTNFWLFRGLSPFGNIYSFDGVRSLCRQDFYFAKRVGLHAENSDIFPFDTGKLLASRCGLIDVRDLGLEKVVYICKQTSKARRALLELENAVQTRQNEKAIDRAQALVEVWKETNETIQSMIVWEERLERMIPVMLGVIGGIVGSMSGLPGMLAGILGGGIGSVPIAQPIAKAFITLHKPSHVATIFDLPERVSV